MKIIHYRKNDFKKIKYNGDALLEALIGIVLLAIIGLGVTYAVSRSLLMQKMIVAKGAAMDEIRHVIQDEGLNSLCNTPSGNFITVAGKMFKLRVGDCVRDEIEVTIALSRTEKIEIELPEDKNSPVTGFSISIENSEDAKNMFGKDGSITVTH